MRHKYACCCGKERDGSGRQSELAACTNNPYSQREQSERGQSGCKGWPGKAQFAHAPRARSVNDGEDRVQQRCGADCVTAWNDTLAPRLGIRANPE